MRYSKKERDGQSTQMGLPLQIDRNEHLPQRQHGEHKGQNGPDAGAPGKKNEEKRESQCQPAPLSRR